MEKEYVVIINDGPGDIEKLSKLHVKLKISSDSGTMGLFSLVGIQENIVNFGWQDIDKVEYDNFDKTQLLRIETIHQRSLKLIIPYISNYTSEKAANDIHQFISESKIKHPEGVLSSEIFTFNDTLGLDFAKSIIINIMGPLIKRTKEIVKDAIHTIDGIKEKSASFFTKTQDEKSTDLSKNESTITKESKKTSQLTEKVKQTTSGGIDKIKSISKPAVLSKSRKKISTKMGTVKSGIKNKLGSQTEFQKAKSKEKQISKKNNKQFILFAVIFTDQDINDLESYINDTIKNVNINDLPFETYVDSNIVKEMAYQFILNRKYLDDHIGVISLSYWNNIWSREINNENFSIHKYIDGYLAIEWKK